MQRDNKYITKVIAASLLGDGSVSKISENRNPVFEISLLSSHIDHLNYLEEVILPITTASYYIRKPEVFIYNNKESKRQEQTRLRTKAHPFFKKFRERMYPHGHKVVDPHYLTLLDWEFLAIWYQEDGYLTAYYSNGKHPQYRIGLSTNGFSYGDNHLLRSALKEKLNLDWNVTNHTNPNGSRSYKLILSPKQIDIVITNTSRYIQPSFEYKINKTTTLARIDALKSNDIV